MIRSEYEPSARCKGITRKGTQCTREATYWHKNKGYCSSHHEQVMAQAKKEKERGNR